MSDIRASIVAEAKGWIGTPYHAHGRVKGVGVDCGMFLAEVYERVGVIPHFAPISYSQQWHLHHDGEMFEDLILGHGAVRIDGQPQPGDVALWRYGCAASHGSIVIEWPLLIHSWIKRGVILSDANHAPLCGHLHGCYTLVGD